MIEPIRMQLRDQETVVVQITAGSASLKVRNREVQFKGNVRLIASRNTLEAEAMSFHPESGTIRVEGDYSLQRGKGKDSQLAPSGNELYVDREYPADSPA